MSQMPKVSQLLKFVSDMNPQNTPTRLSFFNFLRGFAHPDEELNKDLMEQFFNYCMDYPHWAANKSQLGQEIRFLLDNFNGFYLQKFDLSPIRFPETVQIIEIEKQHDLHDALGCFVAQLCGENDKYRLLNDQNKRMIAIILRENKSIEVRVYDKKFTIRNGQLEPLRKDLALFYNANLELSDQHIQRIEVAPYITAQFTVSGSNVTGNLIRGYVFQKLQELKGEPLKEQTRLLFAIKRLEQFFIDRQTDPYYNEMITQLERTCALLQQGDEEAVGWATLLLNQAETALENIFIGDKLLHLLVRDLKNAMNNTKSPAGSKEETCLKISPLKGLDLTN